MTTKEKLLLFVLACVNFTHIMDFMIMMPLGPQFMSLFGISAQQFGVAVSAYSITAGISGFLAATLVADRFDRKKILLFAYIGFVVGTLACAVAPNYLTLVAARVLAGLFGGMIGAQVMSIVSDAFSYERRARAMGIVMTSFSVASVVGVPTGLWLAARYSWHAPFVAIGGLGIFIIGMVWRLVPPVTAHLAHQSVAVSNPWRILVSFLQNPNQRLALLCSTVLMLGHFAIIPYITPSLVHNVGFSQDHIFLIYFVGGLVTIFTSPLVGRAADQRGKYPVFVLFGLLSLIPVWLITNLWPMPLWRVLTVAGLFFIFVNGRMVPMQAMTSAVVTPQQRGSFMGVNSAVTQLSSGLAATIGGMMVKQQTPSAPLLHYPLVGYFSMSMIVLCIVLARKLRPVEVRSV